MKAYGPRLWTLAALFAVRVIAQPLALLVDSPLLPPFESWHSGVMRTSAHCLPAFHSGVADDHRMAVSQGDGKAESQVRQTPPCNRWRVCADDAARLILGATMLRDERWFASPVPTVFHLGLAGFICSCRAICMRAMAKLLPSIHYPATMVGAFAAFAALQAAGMPLIVNATFRHCQSRPSLPGSSCGNQIATRGDRPCAEVQTNLIFMVVVQLALPPLVGFLFAYALVEPASLNLPTARLWPHSSPIWYNGPHGVGSRLHALLAASRRSSERYAMAAPPCITRSSSYAGSTRHASTRSRRHCRCASTASRSCS